VTRVVNLQLRTLNHKFPNAYICVFKKVIKTNGETINEGTLICLVLH
jgi:hypothetical protein